MLNGWISWKHGVLDYKLALSVGFWNALSIIALSFFLSVYILQVALLA